MKEEKKCLRKEAKKKELPAIKITFFLCRKNEIFFAQLNKFISKERKMMMMKKKKRISFHNSLKEGFGSRKTYLIQWQGKSNIFYFISLSNQRQHQQQLDLIIFHFRLFNKFSSTRRPRYISERN